MPRLVSGAVCGTYLAAKTCERKKRPAPEPRHLYSAQYDAKQNFSLAKTGIWPRALGCKHAKQTTATAKADTQQEAHAHPQDRQEDELVWPHRPRNHRQRRGACLCDVCRERRRQCQIWLEGGRRVHQGGGSGRRGQLQALHEHPRRQQGEAGQVRDYAMGHPAAGRDAAAKGGH